jgi:hypothetical protein
MRVRTGRFPRVQSDNPCHHPKAGCVITLRDYDKAERGKGIVKPYGIRDVGGTRCLIWQVRDFEGDRYNLSMYFVEDNMRDSAAQTHVMRSRYYVISPNSVLALMGEVGFGELERLDDVFFQPVLVGRKCA